MSGPGADDLEARQRRLKRQLCEVRETGGSLEDRIERLKAAKRVVAPVDERVEAVWRGVSRLRRDPWKGERRDGFNGLVDAEVVGELQKYAGGASDLYGQICDEIARLEHELNDNDDALGWLKRALRDVQNELDKLVN